MKRNISVGNGKSCLELICLIFFFQIALERQKIEHWTINQEWFLQSSIARDHDKWKISQLLWPDIGWTEKYLVVLWHFRICCSALAVLLLRGLSDKFLWVWWWLKCYHTEITSGLKSWGKSERSDLCEGSPGARWCSLRSRLAGSCCSLPWASHRGPGSCKYYNSSLNKEHC